MNIGVLSLQGAFLKHMQLLKTIGVNPIQVRYEEDLLNLHGLIIPGGESTALSKLIMRQSLYEPIEKFISKYPVYGTCAGLILLSRIIENNKIVKSFEKLDISVKRNAWGRQINSFITNLGIWLHYKLQKLGIHIIDLQSTISCLEKASAEISKLVRSGGNILFVGTKKQAKDVIQQQADRCGMFYVVERWLGGTLTNFSRNGNIFGSSRSSMESIKLVTATALSG